MVFCSFTGHQCFEKLKNYLKLQDNVETVNVKTDNSQIKSIIPASDFQTQETGECYKACVAIMKNFDSNYTEQYNLWALATKNGTTSNFYIHKECYEKAIVALNNLLENGNPVIVGVNYLDVGGNFDGVTNHWVVINGRGTDSKGVYYTYYEVAQSSDLGTSTERNRFYFTSDGYLEALNPTVNSKKYNPIVTVIRYEPNDCACDRNNFEVKIQKKKCGEIYNHTSSPNGTLIKIR
jgi:hypothetical protein